jgi:hypothetical protein
MQGEELQARVKRCFGMAAGHPAWWVAAFFTTLVIDRPLQFLFGSLFLTGRSEVFPSIIDLTSGRDSLLSMFIVVSAVLLVVGKALDYWGQSTLIALADGEAAGTGEGMAEAVRRGWRALAIYAATVLPVDLVRYLLLLLPGFAWLAWRGFDPDFDHWCAYTLIILAWLFICVPMAVALGVFSELAGREVMLGASRPPAAWRSARELGWANRRAVLEAWLPTLAADLAVAAVICALSFGGAWLLFVTRTGLDLTGAVWDVISATVFMLLFVAVKTAHAFAQTFKSALWTLTWRDLSGTVVD